MTTTFVHATEQIERSPAFKFFTLCGLSLLLLIPAYFIWQLVAEREERAENVAREIAQTWGGSQRLMGPFIIVPYEFEETRLVAGEETTVTVRQEAVFLPDDLSVTADASTEVRSRGIFDVTVYTSEIELEGTFASPSRRTVTSEPARFLWTQARLSLSISSPNAIRNAVTLDTDDDSRPFEPGLGRDYHDAAKSDSNHPHTTISAPLAGIHVPDLFEGPPQGFSFTIRLSLNGSDSLFIAPSARDITALINSDWQHPSFTGAALPETSSIDTVEGFSATWRLPHLARTVPVAFTAETSGHLDRLNGNAFGVRFFQPVDYYASVDRALKYAILFIGVAFLSVFVIEMRTGKRVHVVQYVFVGLALVLFYLLLLSLAEHLGFLVAYLIAGSATALLIGSYCARSLESMGYGALVVAVIASMFCILYLFLRLEDYALLAGSIFAFGILAVTMFSTQRIDWSGRDGRKTADAVLTQA